MLIMNKLGYQIRVFHRQLSDIYLNYKDNFFHQKMYNSHQFFSKKKIQKKSKKISIIRENICTFTN